MDTDIRNFRIGFIGAGKVGCSLGQLLHRAGCPIAGYASASADSARLAAERTRSQAFESLEELAAASDILCLSVPDGAIASVWNQLTTLAIGETIVFHCSGALSSAVLTDAERVCRGACSLHPMCAVSSREHGQSLSDAVFTLEGDPEATTLLLSWLAPAGLHIQPISGREKTRYHAAAVMASNLMISLAQEACDQLRQCGFTEAGAWQALAPLLLGNMHSLVEKGPVAALTGPIERNDAETVARHLSALSGRERELYRLLSLRLLTTAALRHPERDQAVLRALLQAERE